MPLSEEILERLFDEARRSPRIAGGFRPPEEFAEEYFRKDYCPPDTFYLDARENVPEIIGDIHTLRDELEKAQAGRAEMARLIRRIDRELTDGGQGPSETISKIAEKIEIFQRMDNPGQPLLDRLKSLEERNEKLERVAKEIQAIMETYREQEKSTYGVDTPGGLEHMGDVWSLLSKWDKALAACPPKEKP